MAWGHHDGAGEETSLPQFAHGAYVPPPSCSLRCGHARNCGTDGCGHHPELRCNADVEDVNSFSTKDTKTRRKARRTKSFDAKGAKGAKDAKKVENGYQGQGKQVGIASLSIEARISIPKPSISAARRRAAREQAARWCYRKDRGSSGREREVALSAGEPVVRVGTPNCVPVLPGMMPGLLTVPAVAPAGRTAGPKCGWCRRNG